MPTFYLIRHGQKEQTDFDPVLTDVGRQQARKTGLFLNQFPIQKVFASPKKRTQQTARYITEQLDTVDSICTDDRLIERMDFGDGKHNNRDEFYTEWTYATRNRTYVPKSGLSSYLTGKRLQSFLEEFKDTNEHVVVVTHGGAIADFLRNVSEEDALLPIQFTFPEGRDFRIDECSVTIISSTGDAYAIHTLHHTKHLL